MCLDIWDKFPTKEAFGYDGYVKLELPSTTAVNNRSLDRGDQAWPATLAITWLRRECVFVYVCVCWGGRGVTPESPWEACIDPALGVVLLRSALCEEFTSGHNIVN